MNTLRTTRITAAAVTLGIGAATLTGCGSSTSADPKPELKVTGGYVRQPPMKDMAAGYLTVTNTGDATDKLTGASSDLSASVGLHTTVNGVMQPVSSFTVPAKGKLVLQMGGNHLMLMNLKKMPKVGDKVTFTLHFATSDPITVTVPVQPATYQPEG